MKWFTAIFALLFLFLLVHSIFTYATNSHCSNYQNRSCAAASWKVWDW